MELRRRIPRGEAVKATYSVQLEYGSRLNPGLPGVQSQN